MFKVLTFGPIILRALRNVVGRPSRRTRIIIETAPGDHVRMSLLEIGTQAKTASKGQSD